MRTTYPVVVVLAIGVGALMFSMSGVSDDVFGQNQEPDAIGQNISDKANNSVAGEGTYNSSAANDGDIVGLVINGVGTIMSVVTLVVALPLALQQIGFPQWFAFPIGIVAELIVSVGVVQFAAGRIWQ